MPTERFEIVSIDGTEAVYDKDQAVLTFYQSEEGTRLQYEIHLFRSIENPPQLDDLIEAARSFL
ncbi:hypothetical protein [Cohnella sp. REN36]|uniref:hypothetical protein n=1 Tax=Cohnella sp. REN36 TaxID=2887347 RepID=UPI001D14D110|nr:hypothetical protein [Cohnella sp. REN36]MCC3371525.1 hypothetical protein [Cohnella sp. REN36]